MTNGPWSPRISPSELQMSPSASTATRENPLDARRGQALLATLPQALGYLHGRQSWSCRSGPSIRLHSILRSTRADRLTDVGNVDPASVCTVATWCEVAVCS